MVLCYINCVISNVLFVLKNERTAEFTIGFIKYKHTTMNIQYESAISQETVPGKGLALAAGS